MKKILLIATAALMAIPTFAQVDKEAEKAAKEAAKAEKAALKAAEKEATAQLNQGIKLRDEVLTLYQANAAELGKGAKADQALIAKNEAQIKVKANQALDVLQTANQSGHVNEKKFYDLYKAIDDVSSQLLNPELKLAAAKQTFDTVTFAKSIDGACTGAYGILQYGKPKDEVQKPFVEAAKLKMPKLNIYYAYLCMFYTETKNINGMSAALEKYANFPKIYPLVANEPSVANPEYPVSQFAFNLYYTGYTMQRFDICDKFYEQALQFDDEGSHNFVVQSRPQIALQKGDTIAWAGMLKEIALDPKGGDAAETATQNLLAYYGKMGPDAMGKFADEMLATNPESKIANYGKGFSLYIQNKFQEALPFYLKTIEIDPEYMEGNFQAGSCLYNIGKENYLKIMDKKYKNQAEADKESEAKVKKYFREAIPYFEKVRELRPEDPNRWAFELRTIYNNLGMKAKAAEIPEI